jgi:hypothetical protein
MAAAESPVVPPSEEPRREPIILAWHDSKPAAAEKEDTPGTPTREGNTLEYEDETTNNDRNVDGASEHATQGSPHESRSDDDSEDSTQAGAQRAVISAIEKMERFQEAIQFNIVDELHDLKNAVVGLPLRGRRTDREPENLSPIVVRTGGSPLRSRSPARRVPPVQIYPRHLAQRTVPPGLHRGPPRLIKAGLPAPPRRPRAPVRRRSPAPKEIDITERRPASSGSRSAIFIAFEK